MKILFATDGSPHALAALESLIEHLGWFRDAVALTLLNVHPALPYRRAAAWAGKDVVAQYYEDEGDSALKPSIDELERRGIPFTTETRVGEAAPAIVALEAGQRHDLSAAGAHRHTEPAHLAHR